MQGSLHGLDGRECHNFKSLRLKGFHMHIQASPSTAAQRPNIKGTCACPRPQHALAALAGLVQCDQVKQGLRPCLLK
eukprot:15631907-Heterocapsa_arctica.AAC.1